MKKHCIYCALALAALFALTGCEVQKWGWYPDGGGATEQTDTQETEEEDGETKPEKSNSEAVTFELPEGWIRGINEEDKSPNRAVQWSPSSDGVKPYVLVVAYGGPGTREEAQSDAKKDHNERMKHCNDAECAKWITYKEMKIAGVDVFISTDVNFYWGADSFSSMLWFEKDGYWYSLEFDDPVEDHLDALETIIKTLRVIQE